ncbi:hypothetical protein BURPS305_4410 [Burkholderia pseudomallei 305]|nr:hypothetical protein BURPS305_4410 [Burkholderia pseudomallei 305]
MRALARRGGITRAARDASPAPVRGRAAAADSAKSRRPLAPHAERDDRPIRRVTRDGAAQQRRGSTAGRPRDAPTRRYAHRPARANRSRATRSRHAAQRDARRQRPARRRHARP